MTRRVWFLLVTVSLVFVAVPQETGPQFVSLDQARPVLEAFKEKLPDELKTRTAGDLKAYWPSWVAKRDREVRARLDQGEEDTITNLLRFGVTYTQQPRIDWPSLFKYGQSVGVDFWVQNRVDDLVSALTKPGKREHLLAARAFLEKRGFAFTTPAERAKAKGALLANLVRMQKEFIGYQEQLRALRAANKLNEAKMLELDSHCSRSAVFPSIRAFVRTSRFKKPSGISLRARCSVSEVSVGLRSSDRAGFREQRRRCRFLSNTDYSAVRRHRQPAEVRTFKLNDATSRDIRY